MDDRAVLTLVPDAGRVRVRLVMPGIERTVEVTGSPAAAVHALEDAAARAGVNPSRAVADSRRVLRTLATATGAWWADDDLELVQLLGGAGYPLLGAAYDQGAGALDTVPRWADDHLARPHSRAAAEGAFGPRATRAVISALARSLVRAGTGPVDLSRLACALIGREVLEPDRIAEVLTLDGPPWPASALPDPRRIARARCAAGYWGARRTRDYLRQAAAGPADRELFFACVDHAVDLSTHAPVRLPGSLEELHGLYRLQIRTTPTSPPRRRAPRRRVQPTSDRSPARGSEPVVYPELLPPRVAGPAQRSDADPIRHPSWLAALDGSTSGSFLFVLPNVCGDLRMWGLAMANCLDSFAGAAVAGASHLVGVLADGRLRYVLELDPHRRIRQFSGRANRPVDRADHDTIVAHLRNRRVVADSSARH